MQLSPQENNREGKKENATDELQRIKCVTDTSEKSALMKVRCLNELIVFFSSKFSGSNTTKRNISNNNNISSK
jgi:hypothetical protein